MSTTTSDVVDWFMDDIIVPTVKEFLAEPANIRRGVLAAITVSSLADYFLHYRLSSCSLTVQDKHRKDPKSAPNELRNEWAGECPKFSLIWDVAEATKHVALTRKNPKKPDLSHISDVQQSNVVLVDGDGATILFAGEEGDFALTLGTEVVASPPNKTQESIVDLLEETLPFLQEKMGRTRAWPLP